MASTAVILDIRANTQRALGEFKKFSAQLDNKFLISGLKLDVVRNALSQINKEFQRAIGEQGLATASSMKGAENQAAVLLDTFKNVGLEAGLSISKNISESLAEVAVSAGGTAEDIKAALAATPFISKTLGEDLRKQLSGGILEFQRDLRRAGLGEEFGNIAKDILSGQADILQLVNSGTPIGSLLGKELLDRGGVVDLAQLTPAKRTELLAEILNDKTLRNLIQEIGKETSGYRGILEDLNTNLFNPRKGIFGYLRDVSLATEGITTNVFKEVTDLVNKIFGPEGVFLNFFESIAKVFGIEDPLRIIIRNIRFLTDQFDRLNEFIQSESFQNIIGKLREVFENIKKFFTNIYDAVINNDANAQEEIKQSIRDVGSAIRDFISKVAKGIKDTDISNEAGAATTIFGTLIEEIGKITVLLIKEIGDALIGKAGTIASKLATSLPGIIGELFVKLFSEGGIIGKAIVGLIATRLGVSAIRAIGGVRQGADNILTGRGSVGGAVNRALNRPIGPVGSLGRGRQQQGRENFSTIGTQQNFQTRVIYYLSRITSCVCGPGGLGGRRDIDINADTPEARRERSRTGRGPRGPRIMPPASSRISPVPRPSIPSSEYLFAPEGPGPRRPRRFTLSQPRQRIQPLSSQYRNPVGPLPLNSQEPWAPTPGGYEPYMYSGVNSFEMRDRAVRDRYERRYGRGSFDRRYGVRHQIGKDMQMLGRGARRFGRGMRGFGKGALITAGIAGGIGLLDGLGGGSAQAAEIDPMTGQPKPTGLQAAGNVLGGGLEGAMLGATIGSIVPGVGTAAGAVIGGVIGGVAPLMDKGTREAVGKFITDIGSSLLKLAGDFANGIKDAVTGGLDKIKEWASGIDWKNLIIDVIFPGRAGLRALATGTGALGTDKEDQSWWAKTKRGLAGLLGIEGNADGLNFAGPALAQESRMSGAKPLIVNDREFVIPSGGFSTLANLVALKNTEGSPAPTISAAPIINLTINVTGVFSEDDIEDALREPVSNIVEDAYRRASASSRNQVNSRA